MTPETQRRHLQTKKGILFIRLLRLAKGYGHKEIVNQCNRLLKEEEALSDKKYKKDMEAVK